MSDYNDPAFNYDGQGKSMYEDAMAGSYALGLYSLTIMILAGISIWIFS